jgi:hypothetical protein
MPSPENPSLVRPVTLEATKKTRALPIQMQSLRQVVFQLGDIIERKLHR